jgi:hypothetical protein
MILRSTLIAMLVGLLAADAQAAGKPSKKRPSSAPGASGTSAAAGAVTDVSDQAMAPGGTPDAGVAGRPSASASAPAPSAPERNRAVSEIVTPAESRPTPPANTTVAAPSAADLDKLRADYDRLREELFRSRARAQIVAEATYPSKLSATLRWKGGADQLIRHAQIRLDGGEIWDSGDKPVNDQLISVAERAVKPGPHALTVRLEIRPGARTKDAEKLGYTSEHTFAIVVADKARTRVEITANEDGDPPEYEPELEIELEIEK